MVKPFSKNFLLKNVIFDTFGTKFVICYIINPTCSSFLTLSDTLTFENDTDEFYNSNSKRMFS